METQDLFHDYLFILQMKASKSAKVQMLKHIFKQYHNRWRVIGITRSALETLKKNDFKYVSGMKIQRAHIHDCDIIYSNLLNDHFKNHNDWWDYYYKHDETVLSLSSENKSIKTNKDIIAIDEKLELFKDNGYVWTHKGNEIEYLKTLYKKHNKECP